MLGQVQLASNHNNLAELYRLPATERLHRPAFANHCVPVGHHTDTISERRDALKLEQEALQGEQKRKQKREASTAAFDHRDVDSTRQLAHKLCVRQ